jgi:topoisomerase-4 subunit A
MLNLSNKLSVLNMTNYGYGFISLHEDIIVKNKKGKTLLKTKDSLAIKPVSVDLDIDTHYLVITSEGYMLIGDLKNIPIMAKGRGVKLINIPKNSTEKIIFLGILNKDQSLFFSYASKKDKSIKYDDLKHFFMERNRRGKKIDKKFLLEKGKTDYNIE